MFWHSWDGVFSACKKTKCAAKMRTPSISSEAQLLAPSARNTAGIKESANSSTGLQVQLKQLKYHYFHQNNLTSNIFPDLAWNSLSKTFRIDITFSHEGLK